VTEIRGVITAMVTPFAADRSLDLDAGRALARRLVDEGSHGLVVTGTTGEAPTLSDDEKLRLLEAVLDEVCGEATVISGTGSNDTRHTAELTAAAARAGAHAVLVVTPYYNKPNRAGIIAHYEAVAEAVGDTRIVLYNIPSRTVINLPPDLLAELGSRIPNVVAVKQANNDDLGPVEGIDVLAGNDEVFARTLGFGGPGGILVASHVVGRRMRELYEAAVAGDQQRAEEIDRELHPIYEAMTVTANPIPVKTALELIGVIDSTMRLPMVAADDDQRAAVRAALEAEGLLVAGGTSA
jgi:4-hydroxy-tetrahydrodipicolinate synthase